MPGEKTMNLRKPLLLTIFVAALCFCPALNAQGARRLTTTLLPLPPTEKLVKNELWIQSKPREEITMRFDLSGLPAGIERKDFTCTLRLSAENIGYEPEGNRHVGSDSITISVEADGQSIAPMEFPDPKTKAQSMTATTEELADAVYSKYDSADKIVSFRLFTETANASSLFYSTSTPNAPPSNLPRLVIEYALDSPSLLEAMSWPQRQQNPEHTGRSVLKPFENPAGFKPQTIALPRIDGVDGTVALVDYPLIWQGNLYVVEHVSNKNYLLTLDFRGNKLNQREIESGTIQRSPVISRNGIFYMVTESRLAAYDLNRDGEKPTSWNLGSDQQPGKLAAYTDLTIGNDGSLFFALKEKGGNYIYGLTSDLKPFLKTGPFSTETYRISTVTVSADGKRIFARTARGPIVIDITNPREELPQGKEKIDQYYHVPIAGPIEPKAATQKGKPEPPKGIMIFSDFLGHAKEGADISGYSAALKPIWSLPGKLLPQPVLGSNGLVYFLRDGKLHSHPYDEVGGKVADGTISGDAKLGATSNLVMDGANNIYFWQSRVLHGYKPTGEDLLTAKDLPELKPRPGESKDEPEQFLRLMVGPDGTLWTNNSNADFLYAFQPTYAKPDLTLTPAQLKQDGNADTPRVYRTTGTLTVVDTVSDPPTFAAGTKTLLQAQEGIAFGKNFSVEKGATLLCRTGF